MQIDRDKIEGIFLGIAIGDSLGMPVETWSAKKIAETYGRVTTYLKPDGHKWFNGHQAGTYTDDTQLSLAVAEAMIEADGLDMDVQVKHHIAALKKTTDGWGHTTRDSIRRLANGVNYKESGSGGDGSGTGNGVAMKLAPLALFYNRDKKFNDFLYEFNCMTHKTDISLSASFAHAAGIKCCLKNNFSAKNAYETGMVENQMVDEIEYAIEVANEYQNLPFQDEDFIYNQFNKLFYEFLQCKVPYADENIIETFKGGCYCFESIPFSYAFFLRNPNSIECLFDVVNAGGDTDSNGSIVGSLLGALHGKSIFPQYLIDGLVQKDEVLDVATRFADKFENKVFW